jgi:hypothetical protein
MTRGVRKYLVSSVVLLALVAAAGCTSHYLIGEREPWRRDAEAACLNSGAVKESPVRVRISSIDGPGICGISYPLKVAALGESAPLGYDDEPIIPPGSIPNASMPQHWPVVQSSPLPPPQAGAPPPPVAPQGGPSYGGSQYGQPPYGQQQYAQPQYGAAQPPVPSVPPSQNAQPPYAPPQYSQPQYGQAQYGQSQYGAPSAGAPMSLSPPGIAPPPDDADMVLDPSVPAAEAPGPYSAPPVQSAAPGYPPGRAPAPYGAESAPLGPPSAPEVTAMAGPVEVKPPATLACPIVSVLDQWIAAAVQPAAMQWFRQPVVEIKQISSYSCRGMNGDPNAHISEHAFGNALDVAEFTLADGHKISVQYGWHGTPEEQGFLHDVQAAACQDFTTVLAPGANVYHYNHIHVDLMRHYNGRHICEPTAISGEVAAERARARYAGQRYGDPGVTGSIETKPHRPLAYSGDDDHLPLAVPGED